MSIKNHVKWYDMSICPMDIFEMEMTVYFEDYVVDRNSGNTMFTLLATFEDREGDRVLDSEVNMVSYIRTHEDKPVWEYSCKPGEQLDEDTFNAMAAWAFLPEPYESD
jgi:hypothetical protein